MSLFYRAVHWDGIGASANGEWWCDVFGPYDIPLDPMTHPSTEASSHRGVGPFLMRLQKGTQGHFMLACIRCHRKKNPCRVYAVLNLDGSFVRRRHLHNHLPEAQLPTPLSGHMQLPAPPTFEEVVSIVLPPISRGPRQDVLEDFDTKLSTWDPNTQQMVETQITLENSGNIAKGARIEIIDGKKVFYCPVPTCNYTFGNTQAVHIHMSVHVRGRRMASVQASERLCPLCRIDMGSHEILVRHIVDDHDTRLECTEHEFETMDDFKNWKSRTEQEDMATFTNIGHRRSGVYNCCRTGRKLTQDEYSMHTAYRKRLGVECPAAMFVTEVGNRVSVIYWRTHIGHTPNILDVKVSDEQRHFIMELLKKGYKRRAIVAEAAKKYFGQPLSRSFILDLKTLNQLCNVHRKFSDKRCTIDVPYMSEKGYNSDYLRVRLVRRVRECLELLAQPDDESHRTAESERVKHKIDAEFSHVVRHEVTGHVHVYRRTLQSDGAESNVVFPRKAPHESCEKRCEDCRVCVHRYGCTCKKFMLEDHMCPHVHLVASKEGSPGPSWVDPTLQEDTVGLQEALRRLQRVNHRERLKTLRPRIDEVITLLQGELNVNLDQLDEFLSSGLMLLRTSRPRQPTRDDEAGETQPLAPKELFRLVRDRHPDYTALQFTDMPQKWKSGTINVDKMLALADERVAAINSEDQQEACRNEVWDFPMDEVHIKIEPLSQTKAVAIKTSAKYGGLIHDCHGHLNSDGLTKGMVKRARRSFQYRVNNEKINPQPAINPALKSDSLKRNSEQLKRLKKAKQILATKGPKSERSPGSTLMSRLSTKARRRWGLRRAPWIELPNSAPLLSEQSTGTLIVSQSPPQVGISLTKIVTDSPRDLAGQKRHDSVVVALPSEIGTTKSTKSNGNEKRMSQKVKMPVMVNIQYATSNHQIKQRVADVSQQIKVPLNATTPSTQTGISRQASGKVPFTVRAQRAAQIQSESSRKTKATTRPNTTPAAKILVLSQSCKELPHKTEDQTPTIVQVNSLPKHNTAVKPFAVVEKIQVTTNGPVKPSAEQELMLLDTSYSPVNIGQRSFIVEDGVQIELS